MKIGSLYDGRPPIEPTAGRSQTPPAKRDLRKGDNVDISDNSRAKLSRSADKLLKLEQEAKPVYVREDFAVAPKTADSADSSAERERLIKEIRDRIESGYYKREDIANLVADKLAGEFND